MQRGGGFLLVGIGELLGLDELAKRFRNEVQIGAQDAALFGGELCQARLPCQLFGDLTALRTNGGERTVGRLAVGLQKRRELVGRDLIAAHCGSRGVTIHLE